ncbi:MAG: hypothetical protein WD069_16310 [Planctomycetales bacterium]
MPTPAKTRTKPAAIIAVIAVLSLAASLLSVFSWIEGRLNGAIPGLAIEAVALLVWIACVGLLIVWILVDRRDGPPKSVSSLSACLLISFLPWILVGRGSGSEEAFLQGFGAWARANVSSELIRDSIAKSRNETAPTKPPYWWPVEMPNQPFGSELPQADWPVEISDLSPDDVRVIREARGESLVLSWRPDFHPFGWPRLVYANTSGADVPSRLQNHPLAYWQRAERGVWVGFRTWP